MSDIIYMLIKIPSTKSIVISFRLYIHHIPYMCMIYLHNPFYMFIILYNSQDMSVEMFTLILERLHVFVSERCAYVAIVYIDKYTFTYVGTDLYLDPLWYFL